MQIPAFLAVLVLRLALLALPRKHNTSLLPKSEAGGAFCRSSSLFQFSKGVGV